MAETVTIRSSLDRSRSREHAEHAITVTLGWAVRDGWGCHVPDGSDPLELIEFLGSLLAGRWLPPGAELELTEDDLRIIGDALSGCTELLGHEP